MWVSGDGEYNEVVNGVLAVHDSQADCAPLAGGNANDHPRSTRRVPLNEAIVDGVDGEVRHINLLRLTQGEGAAVWTPCAHSYIHGRTRDMVIGLERGNKGTLNELVSVIRTFTQLQPLEISRDGRGRGRGRILKGGGKCRMQRAALAPTGPRHHGRNVFVRRNFPAAPVHPLRCGRLRRP
ncbi:hypothetical protein [Specibacter cremeus]|uniref:hypothetical protein n=1 Tax=Specibacter cremeus TaxID=1629051 RepID=UPI003B834F80